MAEYSLMPDGRILRELDQLFIPQDPGNMDFVAYQAWVDAGNVPSPSVDASALETRDGTFATLDLWSP